MLKPKRTLKEVREQFYEDIKNNPQFQFTEFTKIFDLKKLRYVQNAEKYPKFTQDNVVGLQYYVNDKTCRFGVMQAGSITTLIDILTMTALSCFFSGPKSRLTASLQMNQSRTIKQDQWIDIIMEVKSITESWAQVSCEIYNEKNQLCVSGFQIMSFLNEEQKQKLLEKMSEN